MHGLQRLLYAHCHQYSINYKHKCVYELYDVYIFIYNDPSIIVRRSCTVF